MGSEAATSRRGPTSRDGATVPERSLPVSPPAPIWAAVVPRLTARGLTRRFGERVAVDGVDFDAAPGEVLGFLGPNGAGKSTLFHLLTGLLAPDAGEMRVDGRVARPTDPAVRACYGVVFQSKSLDDKLTARENLVLGAALHAVPRREALGRVDEALRWMDLAGRADEPVERLSGGMRRRLEVARALLHAPQILVLDEPTQGLDQTTFLKVWERIAAERARGMTALVTTHRPEEAERCDRIAVLDRGRIVACDTPAELKKHVGGDVLTIEADDPEGLAAQLSARFDRPATVVGGTVTLERRQGHELIPRIVESLPAGRLRSVSLRRPTLADVFLKITGRGLA